MKWSSLFCLQTKIFFFFILTLTLSVPFSGYSQCCTGNALEDSSMESSITVDEKFPDAVTTTSNNAKTADLPQWFYDDGTNDDAYPTTVNDPTRASDGDQFVYIPKPATASVYNSCVGNSLSYAASYSCQTDQYTTGVRYITSFDYIPFNKDVPTGGTGEMTPVLEFQAPGVFSVINIYDSSGNILDSNESAVSWSSVASSWKTAYGLIPSVNTTGTNIVWYSHHKDGTCGMLFDNVTLVMIELQSHGLDNVQAGSDNTEIEFTLNPANNIVGIPDVYYEVVAPSGYTVTPSTGIYNQETNFVLSIDSGNFETGSESTISIEVRDQVNTGCSVTANIDNSFNLNNDGDSVGALTDLDDDNDGIPDTQELCGTDPSPVLITTPVDVEINLDNWPGETTWNLSGPSGIIYSGGPYSYGYRNLTLSGALDISENGNYTFNIFDSYGDGLGGNSYSVDGVDFSLITESFEDGVSSSVNFTVTSINNNAFSCLSADPLLDSDDDGVLNYKDADFCTLNAAGVCEDLDKDGDGIINSMDIDSDNDGITDIVENADGDVSLDNGGSGILNGRVYNFTDSNNDGWNDSSISASSDMDADNLPNYLDIDADNDGISDYVEGVCTTCPTAVGPSGADTDGDGLLDFYETLSADNTDYINGSNQGITPYADSDDSDDVDADFLDTDADGDGAFDWNEGFDLDGDGSALDDLIDIAANYESAVPAPGDYTTSDTDNDDIPNWADNLDGFGYTESGVPPFLDASNAAWIDEDNDGLVALFDITENGTKAPTPDNNGGNDDDWRDAGAIAVLPVELIDFSVAEEDCKALFEWTTAKEINLDRFEIEHSSDGVDFRRIAVVSAKGGSRAENYNFTYDTPEQVNIYRLKMIDFDGTIEYSDMEVLETECFDVSIYPNPLFLPKSSVTVYFKKGVAPEYVQVFNELGKLLLSVRVPGEYTKVLELDLQPLISGIYYFKFGNSHTEKIVVLE